MKQKVLIGGGSGLVGSRLTQLLQEKGYEVGHLSRSSSKKGIKTIHWDVAKQKLDAKAIETYDYIINLAGAGIVDEPWTAKRKQAIIDSRVNSTQLLAKVIKENSKKPLSYVSASAVGYYGIQSTEHVFTELESAGKDFLANISVLWENSSKEIESLGVPVAKIRIGFVLANGGGALKEISKPIKFGFGASLGTGKQYMPWIHLDDLCRIFIHALENKLQGAYNAAAPNPVNNKTFTKTLAKVLNKPLWLPNVPAFMIRLILGSRAMLILEGSRVSCEKIQKSGFEFEYSDLRTALAEIY